MGFYLKDSNNTQTYISSSYLRRILINSNDNALEQTMNQDLLERSLIQKINVPIRSFSIQEIIDRFKEILKNEENSDDLLATLLTFNRATILATFYASELVSTDIVKQVINSSNSKTRIELLISSLSTIDENIEIDIFSRLNSKLELIPDTNDYFSDSNSDIKLNYTANTLATDITKFNLMNVAFNRYNKDSILPLKKCGESFLYAAGRDEANTLPHSLISAQASYAKNINNDMSGTYKYCGSSTTFKKFFFDDNNYTNIEEYCHDNMKNTSYTGNTNGIAWAYQFNTYWNRDYAWTNQVWWDYFQNRNVAKDLDTYTKEIFYLIDVCRNFEQYFREVFAGMFPKGNNDEYDPNSTDIKFASLYFWLPSAERTRIYENQVKSHYVDAGVSMSESRFFREYAESIFSDAMPRYKRGDIKNYQYGTSDSNAILKYIPMAISKPFYFSNDTIFEDIFAYILNKKIVKDYTNRMINSDKVTIEDDLISTMYAYHYNNLLTGDDMPKHFTMSNTSTLSYTGSNFYSNASNFILGTSSDIQMNVVNSNQNHYNDSNVSNNNLSNTSSIRNMNNINSSFSSKYFYNLFDFLKNTKGFSLSNETLIDTLFCHKNRQTDDRGSNFATKSCSFNFIKANGSHLVDRFGMTESINESQKYYLSTNKDPYIYDLNTVKKLDIRFDGDMKLVKRDSGASLVSVCNKIESLLNESLDINTSILQISSDGFVGYKDSVINAINSISNNITGLTIQEKILLPIAKEIIKKYVEYLFDETVDINNTDYLKISEPENIQCYKTIFFIRHMYLQAKNAYNEAKTYIDKINDDICVKMNDKISAYKQLLISLNSKYESGIGYYDSYLLKKHQHAYKLTISCLSALENYLIRVY